jgi:Arc/MetJ-type ribon-helix-helix transcriptional regulator
MQLSLRPELQRFLDDQVKAGRYASQQEAVEAGIARLMLDPPADHLDAQDVQDIRRSVDELRRCEVIDWREFSAQVRKKYLER